MSIPPHHPPNHPTTRESKDRAKFNYFLHPELQQKNFFYKIFLALTNNFKLVLKTENGIIQTGYGIISPTS